MNKKKITAIAVGAMLIGGGISSSIRPASADIKITDDKVGSVDSQLVQVTQNEPVVTYSGSLKQLEAKIAVIDSQIENLQTRRASLVSLEESIQTEVDKLPARLSQQKSSKQVTP